MTENPPKIPCPCRIEGCRIHHQALPENATPLSSACGRDKFKVCRINGDRRVCARMAQLGVLPGSEIELICPGRKKQCMVKVKGSTVTLDELLADHIMVTPA